MTGGRAPPTDTNSPRLRSVLVRYGVAGAALLAAVATRVALAPWLGASFPLVTAYPAVALAAAIGGRGPGLVTVLVCAAAGLLTGIPPRLSLASAADVTGLILLLGGGAVIVGVVDSLQRARGRAEASRSHAERELGEYQRIEATLVATNRRLERRLAERDEFLALEQTARAEAQRRQREADAASRAKDEFLAVLGHELRNPLGAISTAIQALHETGDRVVKLQSIIGRQSRHLARLLDDLLDLSRVTMGKTTLQRQPVDLREIVERALASLEHEHKTEGREVSVGGDAALVDGDPVRLEQVAGNLLDNALKYTPRGGHVDAVVECVGQDAVLRVRDTGAGIAADVLPRIFQPFVQAETTRDRSLDGLGLGLAVVKHLVELHGGSVTATSAGPGQGSEFVVRLPRLVDAEPAPEPAASELPKATARRILVIEDHQDVRDGLRMLLESWGHQVDEAADGRRGLEMALAGSADAVLVDLSLPELDGYAVARAIRADARAGRLFLVAATGYGQPADVERARAAGFDAILVKPIDPGELVRILARAGAARYTEPPA